MRTSYKKNRPFDFKLIDQVEPNTLLYKRQTGLSNYDVMKAKNEIWSKIAQVMDCDVNFCLMRWNNLYYHYRKESRRTGGSTWPYFERLRFLSGMSQRPRAKPKSQPDPKVLLQAESMELPKDSLVDNNDWQSYNDCIVMQVSDISQHADNTYIIEEIIEQSEQIIQEEIIYEDEEQEREELQQKQLELTETDKVPNSIGTQMATLLSSPENDYLKMDTILQQLQSTQRNLAERRIMAFVLKCQLRALVNEPIDDLVI